MRHISDTYYKWSPNPPLMSGIQPQSTYENVQFYDCDFHPACKGKVKFVNCEFHDCQRVSPDDCDADCKFVFTAPATFDIYELLDYLSGGVMDFAKGTVYNPWYGTVVGE